MKYMVITSVTGKYQIIISLQAPQENQLMVISHNIPTTTSVNLIPTLPARSGMAANQAERLN